MFNKLAKRLEKWFEGRNFEAELNRQLAVDPWLRQVYICVNLYLTSEETAKENQTSFAIQNQMTDEYRREIALNVALQLLKISNSRNRVLDCRLWIVSVISEYAPIRALYTTKDTYADEVDNGIRHDSTYGLYESFEVYAPKVYSQYFPSKTYQGTDENKEELRKLSLMYHFMMDIGNMARIGLDDLGDWYREFFSISVAYAEANLRSDQAYPTAILGDERESLRREILRQI